MAEMEMVVRNVAPPSALLPTSSASINAWSRKSRTGRPETDSLESQVSHLVQPSLKFHVTKFGFSATESRKFKALSQ
eukprot:3612682-Pleurochrysis_carterae.AAC.1